MMNKIIKVVFYNSYNNELKSAIFYDDGQYRRGSREDGIKAVHIMSKTYNIPNLKELENRLYVELFTEEELQKFIQKRKENFAKSQQHTTRKNETNNKENISNSHDKENKTSRKSKQDKEKEKTDNTVEEDPKRRFKWLKRLIIFSTVAAILYAHSDCKWSLKKIDWYDLIPTPDDSENEEIVEEATSATVDDIFNLFTASNMNAIKRRYFREMWLYLNNYNVEIANKYKTKTNKVAHDFGEVQAQYLMYNYLNDDVYACIFERNDIDFNILKEQYKSAIKQDVMLHIVQEEPLDLQIIINKQSAKDIYFKYESMLLKFNNESDDKIKIKLANEFFKTVRTDFKDKESITTDMLITEPFIKAMQKMCKNHSKIKYLNEKEFKKINGLFNQKVDEMINKYSRYVSYNSGYESVSCSDLQNAIASYLNSNNNYSIDPATRNITQGKMYKKHLNWQNNGHKKSKN